MGGMPDLPDAPGPSKPHRRFKLVLELETHNLDDLRAALRQITFKICNENVRDSVSGGSAWGYVLKVTEDPDMTPEQWERELMEYVNKLDNEG